MTTVNSSTGIEGVVIHPLRRIPDERGMVTFVNAGWLAYTGTSLEEELGPSWSVGVHPDDAPEVLSAWTATLERRATRALFAACERVAAGIVLERRPPRRLVSHRDLLLEVTGEDADALYHPLLIRLVSAFYDQGVAYWPMSERGRGLYPAFLQLYGPQGSLQEAWAQALPQAIVQEDGDPARSVWRSLALLGVAEEEREEIARMLGGIEISKETRAAAREMLKSARR